MNPIHALAGSRRAAMVAAVSAATLAVGGIGASSALAASGGPVSAKGSTVPTPSANAPAATATGTTAATTTEDLSFVLKENNQQSLENAVDAGMSKFLSVSQFAAQYGQSTSYINALTKYLKGYGITTSVYPDHIDVSATGTAAQFNQALGTSQENYSAPAVAAQNGSTGIPAQNYHANSSPASLPSNLANGITAILGLSSYSNYTTNLSHVNTSVLSHSSSANTPSVAATSPGGSVSPAACEDLTGLSSGCHLPQDYDSEYNLTPLENKGDTGQGQTVAIVTLAALDPSAPDYYWKNIQGLTGAAASRSVAVDNVDGGPGAPSAASGSDETDLDVEQSGGVAPGANVEVYQAPNTDPGFFDAFATAASADNAGSVSTSWGASETVIAAAVASGEETAQYEETFDEVFLELAAQGQSAFTSSADSGAYTAYRDLGTTNLSVDVPADSPYITDAGGTTLPWSGVFTNQETGDQAQVSVAAQRAWGWDYTWGPIASIDDEPLLAAAESNIVGSGGGYSTIEPEPSYQSNIPSINNYSATQWLTPDDFQNVGGITEPTGWTINPNPAVSTGHGYGRAMPDVATDADPYSGYLLYVPSFSAVGDPTLEGGYGGTSFVAPELNGSAAVIESSLGHRVGFWNPTLYGDATGSKSATTPLDTAGTSNDNLFYTGTPGAVFNPATGLGTPNLTKLASDF